MDSFEDFRMQFTEEARKKVSVYAVAFEMGCFLISGEQAKMLLEIQANMIKKNQEEGWKKFDEEFLGVEEKMENSQGGKNSGN